MLKNYIKIAWRNLLNQKFYAGLNILGLTVGITSCLLLVLYIQHELSYDRYNEKADRTYRMIFKGQLGTSRMEFPYAGAPAAATMVKEFPEVEAATRLYNPGNLFVSYEERTLKEEGAMLADSNFFEIFSIPLLRGNVKTVLNRPNTVVLSRTAAEKYFGQEDPIGKILKIDYAGDLFTVTGVFEDFPANSHFKSNMLLTMLNNEDSKTSDGWMNMNYFTYLVLRDGYDQEQLEAKFPAVVETYMGPEVKQYLGVSLDEFRKSGSAASMYLQPLTDVHLHSSHLTQDIGPHGNISYVYIFSAIAVFILLIACINFMNLATARSAKRAKEVGIRKVLGSVKQQLVVQFITESILLTVIAAGLALVLVEAALPFFSSITGKGLRLEYFSNSALILILIAICVFVGLFAGSYPAFFLSSFQPVKVLKGTFAKSKSSSTMRSSLVVFQFFISMGLIAATGIVYQQLNYMQNKKAGFDREHMLVVQDSYLLGSKESIFRDNLKRNAKVVNASVSGYIPVGSSYHNLTTKMPEEDQTKAVSVNVFRVDEEYIPTYGMGMVAGRNFSTAYATDSTAIIVNEAAVRAFGWQDPVGKKVYGFAGNADAKIAYHVIGVVEDFHFASLHSKISPLVMMYGGSSGSVTVKVKGDDIPGVLSAIESEWRAMAPDAAFSYSFLDERFVATYQAERKTGQIFGFFAVLAIFIASLGLLGLAAFTAEQRIKEIGIRKVLGASSTSIVGMLSKDFLKLVLVAIVIASPVAWFVMSRWLEDFAYRIDISPWTFVLAGGIALLIALVTVSFQAFKAAIMNPVKSLRNE